MGRRQRKNRIKRIMVSTQQRKTMLLIPAKVEVGTQAELLQKEVTPAKSEMGI